MNDPSRIPATAANARRPNYGRRRAVLLLLVHVLAVAHFVHWKLAGKTLAPLELNEVMHALELGVVTAGFVFMLLALVSVLVFGRFFCSWGCHVLALEDLCAWLLARLRIRPRPIRSRVLLLVPPAVMLYMFVWPQVLRVVAGRPFPGFRVVRDSNGWTSFATNDLLRNLPGPWVAGLTLFICGFAVVYVLGSRSFCLHACPYGAIFALADRLSPGHLVVTGDCTDCGRCTAVCQSHVRVHEELQVFGKVVDPACLKDLDCVSACPEGALGFGFRRPSLMSSWRRAGRRAPVFDFSLGEELTLALSFLTAVLVFRGLYDRVPFLLTLGLGGILGYLAVLCSRLARRPRVRFNNFLLKREGSLTPSGRGFVVACGLLGVLVAHSAFIRRAEVCGHRGFERLRIAASTTQLEPDSPLITDVLRDLGACADWGLLGSPRLHRRLATTLLLAGVPNAAAPHLARLRRAEPGADHELRGDFHANQGELASAEAEYRLALAADPDRVGTLLALGGLLSHQGDLEGAARQLARAVQLEPDSASSRVELAALLARLGRNGQAVTQYRAAALLSPRDAAIPNSLGTLLLRVGRSEAAAACFRQAVEIEPGSPVAHLNLARLLIGEGREDEAEVELRTAARLDSRYERPLREWLSSRGRAR